MILRVAMNSGNLKGTFQRALKQAVSCIKQATETLAEMTVNSETRKLQAQNARLQAELADLRDELARLRRDMGNTRQRVETSPGRSLVPETAGSSEVPTGQFMRSVMDQVGTMITARFDAIEERLLPAKRIRPPLAVDERQARAEKRNATPTPVSEKSVAQQALASCASVPGKKGKGKSKKTTASSNATQQMASSAAASEPLMLASAPNTTESPWTLVQKRSTKRKVAAQIAPQQKPQPKVVKLRPPRSAAVVITLQEEAEEKGMTYAKALAEAKSKIDLSELGINALRFRQAATGARVLEVPGLESEEKADSLANKLRETLGPEIVRVSRPTKCVELRISGLDDSVTSEDVSAAVARAGACSVEQIKCGEIRRGTTGLGTVWLRCPVAAAKPVVDNGRLLVGWVAAQVRLLDPRPMCCFRCLEEGHVKVRCCSEEDRSAQCYRCGQLSHKAVQCTAAPYCTLCAAKKRPTNHRVGSKVCTAYSSGKRKRGDALARSQPARSSAAAEEVEMATPAKGQ